MCDSYNSHSTPVESPQLIFAPCRLLHSVRFQVHVLAISKLQKRMGLPLVCHGRALFRHDDRSIDAVRRNFLAIVRCKVDG